MSLAMYAAPFNDNSNNDEENNIINQKRQHNKTQKKYPKDTNFVSEKVNSILETIHDNPSSDEDGNNLGDFNPPPKPVSSGVTKTKDTEDAMNKTDKMNTEMFSVLDNTSSSTLNYDANAKYDMNDYSNYGTQESNEEFYKKMLPNYNVSNGKLVNPNNKLYYANPSYNNYNLHQQSTFSNDDVLIKKINYMIHLLEEQQDERTSNVTEEVVLYSFLGIFIIFVIDSFVRVGKYVR
jgi:hypothetical protein